ncbi:MAG TPA: hypothetical protein VJ841_00215 [Candidatus Saccharimonadales bacterium]|nr:hypothetical protein [Candidatus Saccharimonadales bacterium]
MALFSKKQASVPRRRQQQANDAVKDTQATSTANYTFRRNRTITGSASSNVTGVSEANAQLQSPRTQAHQLARRRRHLGSLFLIVLLSAGALALLISQFTAQVTVRASDITIQLDGVYEKVIQEYLSDHPVERLRFMTDQAELAKYVRSKTPEVSDIHVDGGAGFGKSAFTVTLRTPIAGWSVGGEQKYVDTHGVSFDRNYFKAPAVQIVDNSGIPAQAGQAVASNRFLGFVGLVVGQAKQYGYTVTQVVIPERTTRQIQLRLDGVGYPVTVSIDRGAGEQMEDMSRSIKWLKEHNVSPAYLDVRVEGKAIYK